MEWHQNGHSTTEMEPGSISVPAPSMRVLVVHVRCMFMHVLHFFVRMDMAVLALETVFVPMGVMAV